MQARNYQLKVFKSAIKTNTIAFLPTGTRTLLLLYISLFLIGNFFIVGAGKTLIAILLIEHYLRKNNSRSADESRKIIVFVAPTKLLLHQQEAAIKNLCPLDLTVSARCYTQDSVSTDGTTVNFLSKTFWEKQLRTYNVFLCIPEIFRAILEKKLVNPSDFSLVVIDECHNAFGDSSMCVMCELLHTYQYGYCDIVENPQDIRILGLTASPVTTKETTALDSISRLEEITKCTLVYPKEMSDEIQLYFKPPKLQILLHEELNLNCLYSDTPIVNSSSKQKAPPLNLVYSQMSRVCEMLRPCPAFRSHAQVVSSQDSVVMLLHAYVRMTYCEVIQSTLKIGYEFNVFGDIEPSQWTCNEIVVKIQQILAAEKNGDSIKLDPNLVNNSTTVASNLPGALPAIGSVHDASRTPDMMQKPVICLTKRDLGNLMSLAEECGFLCAIDSYMHILSSSLKAATSAAEAHFYQSQSLGATEVGTTPIARGHKVHKTNLVDVTKALAQVREMEKLSPFSERDLINNCKVQIVTMVEIFYALVCVLDSEHRDRSVHIMDQRIEALYKQYVVPVRKSMQQNVDACQDEPSPTVDVANYLDFSMFRNVSSTPMDMDEDRSTGSIPDKVLLLFNMFVLIRLMLVDLNNASQNRKRQRDWEKKLLQTPYFCGSNGIFDVYYRSRCQQYPSGVLDGESPFPYGEGVAHYAFRTNSTNPSATIDNCLNECNSFIIMLSTAIQQVCRILLDAAPMGEIQDLLMAKNMAGALRNVVDTVDEMEATGLLVKPSAPTVETTSMTHERNSGASPLSKTNGVTGTPGGANASSSFGPCAFGNQARQALRDGISNDIPLFRKQIREWGEGDAEYSVDCLSLLISPKVMALFGILLHLADEDGNSNVNQHSFMRNIKWRSIVFIQTRLMACSLSRVLSLIKVYQSRSANNKACSSFDGIRPVVLIGQEKQSNQVSVMEEFKLGTYNILFATSVAEEGIDVQACNCVINFHAVGTTKCFIQRRGRARAKNGCMITLVPSSQDHRHCQNDSHLSPRAVTIVKELQSFIKNEEEMQRVGASSSLIVKKEREAGEEIDCGQAGDDMKAIRDSGWFRAMAKVNEEEAGSSLGMFFLSSVTGINENGSKGSFYLGYEVHSTKARCDTRSSVALFNQYCNAEHLEYIYSVNNTNGTQKDIKFRYRLEIRSDAEVFKNYFDYYADDSKGTACRFPSGSYLLNKVSSGYLSNKKLCKAICSLRCIQLLHAAGQLDDYLSPTSTVKSRAALERLRVSLSKSLHSGKIVRASDAILSGGEAISMDDQKQMIFKTVPDTMIAGDNIGNETVFLYRFKHLKYCHDSKWNRNPPSYSPRADKEADARCQCNADVMEMDPDSCTSPEMESYRVAVKERLATFGISKCSYCQLYAANIYDNMGVAYLKKLPEDIEGLPIAIREADMCLEYIGEKHVSSEEMSCMQSFHRAVLGWQCDEFAAGTNGQVVTPEEWSKSSNGLWYCIFPVVQDIYGSTFLDEICKKASEAQYLMRNLLFCRFMVKFQEIQEYQHVVRAARNLLPPLLDRNEKDVIGAVQHKILCRGYHELFVAASDYHLDTSRLYDDILASKDTKKWNATEILALNDDSIEKFVEEYSKNVPSPATLSVEEEYALLLREDVEVTATGLPCRDVRLNTIMGNFDKTKRRADMYLVDPVTLLPLLSDSASVPVAENKATSIRSAYEMDKKLFQELGNALRKSASELKSIGSDKKNDLSFVKMMHNAVVGEFSRKQKKKLAYGMVTFAEYYLNSGKINLADEEREFILNNLDTPMIAVRSLHGNYTLVPWWYSMIVNDVEITSTEPKSRNIKKPSRGNVEAINSSTSESRKGEWKKYNTHDHISQHVYPYHCRILGDARWFFMGLVAPPVLWKVQAYVHAYETREIIYSRMKLPMYRNISMWTDQVRQGMKKCPSNDCLKPGLEMFLSSISPRMLQEPCNAERLEYLGDIVLKAIVSVELYLKLTHANEHILTVERTKLICNLHLYRVGISNGIGKTLRTIGLSSGTQMLNVLPPGMVSNACVNMHKNPMFAWKDEARPPSEVLVDEIESDRCSVSTRMCSSQFMWAFDDEDISNCYHTLLNRNFSCVKQVPRKATDSCESERLSDVAKQRDELIRLRELEGFDMDVEPTNTVSTSLIAEDDACDADIPIGHAVAMIKPKYISDMLESLLGVYFLHGNYNFSEEGCDGTDRDTFNIGIEAGMHFLKSMNILSFDFSPRCNEVGNENYSGAIQENAEESDYASIGFKGLPDRSDADILDSMWNTGDVMGGNNQQIVASGFRTYSTHRLKVLFSDFCVRPRSNHVALPAGDFAYKNYAKVYPRKFLSYDLTVDPFFAQDYHFNMNAIRRIFDYEFCNYSLLLEALTHNSCVDPTAASGGGGRSYERLEYLGDAVLDLIVCNYLYKGLPDAQEGLLSAAKVSIVENKSLGGASERLGLYALLYVKDISLRTTIRNIYVSNSTKSADAASTDSAKDFKEQEDLNTVYEEKLSEMSLSTMKTLADVYESVIGAIFIDCNRDYAVVSRVVRKSLRLNERIQHLQEVCALLKQEMQS